MLATEPGAPFVRPCDFEDDMDFGDPTAVDRARAALPHETERLRLRELVLSDANFILDLVNDPAWLRFVGNRKVHTTDDAERYIDRVREGSYADRGFGLWAMDLRTDGTTVGIAGLIKRVVLPVPDVGFALLERHRGNGYAREGVAGTLEVAKRGFGFTRVASIITQGHRASERVVETNGFELEGPFRWEATGETLSLYTRDLD